MAGTFSGAEVDLILGGQKILKKCHYVYMEHYPNPMYDGQIPWTEWSKLLPFEFKLIYDFGNDVLLENLNYQ